MRQAIVLESDTHGGQKFGLMNPAVELPKLDIIVDELGFASLETTFYTPEATQGQLELWALRNTNIDRIKSILSNYGKVVYIHNGDLTQGTKHPAALVSTRQADQILIAAANLRPIFDIDEIKIIRFSSGTEAHNFGQGSSDIEVAEILKKEYPKKNMMVYNHGFATLEDDFTVDYAHHGPHPGSRSWLSGNVARFYLRDIMMQRVARGLKPPDLVVRSHFHQPIIETVRYAGYTSNIVITPSMCLVDDHTLQSVRSPETVTCGMMMADVVDGKLLDIHQFTKTFNMLQEERL